MIATFTPQQLLDYAAYEFVRTSAEYNMLSRQAQESTGLTNDRYMFVLKNYTELRKQFELEEDRSIQMKGDYFYGAYAE